MSSVLEALAPLLAPHLTPEERDHAVAYAVDAQIEAGARLALPGVEIAVPTESYLVFVDREPTANWGHSARYLVIARTGREVRSIEARLPPFRPDGGPRWRVVYQAPSAPDSAVAVPR